MKLKEILKNITKYILVILVVLFSAINIVSAASAPSSVKIDHYLWEDTPISLPFGYYVKYITGDKSKYVYCLEYYKNSPNNVKYNLGKEITDPGVNYILERSVGNNSNYDTFVTQVALWIYMQDAGLDKKTSNVTTLKEKVNNSSSDAAIAIKKLVSGAKKATTVNNNLTLNVNTKSLTFTISSDNKFYVSNTIKVTSDADYKVSIDSAPSGTVKEEVDGGFRIKVPVSSVSGLSTNISVSISASKTVYHSYQYNPSDSSYQAMSYTISEKLDKKVSLTGNISTTQVTISKIDVTNGQELPGAKLNLNCNNGKYVKEWVSTTEPVVLTDVPEGTCTLTETQAPDGYVLSTESITFTVVAGKATAKQVMKNKPEDKTFDVEISKVSITDSSELPGAKLEVTDSNNNVVCSWTSDGTVHTCKDLPAGTYTLTEITAPDGYEKAESITFTLDKDGNLYQGGEKVNKITMVDEVTPTVIPDVPNTLSLKGTMVYIIGLSVVVAGISMIIKLVRKNEQ